MKYVLSGIISIYVTYGIIGCGEVAPRKGSCHQDPVDVIWEVMFHCDKGIVVELVEPVTKSKYHIIAERAKFLNGYYTEVACP